MSEQNYSWRNVRHSSTFHLPKSEKLGRWIWAAITLAIIVHGIVLIALKQIPVMLNRLEHSRNETLTQPMKVDRVEFDELVLAEQPDEILETPQSDALDLLNEIDLLEVLPEDLEVDVSPTIENPEISVAMEIPAATGALIADALEPVAAPDFTTDVPELGSTKDFFKDAADGQVVIDAGALEADEHDPDAFTDGLLKKGAEGLADTGAIDGYTTLADMQNLSGSALETSKALIGSDLLFEYNSKELRQTARHSLLKVALLIDKNPEMNCWVEGHSDLFGGVEFNQKLSLQRAQAVKRWLVESMRLDPERVIVRGLGKSDPIVKEGDQDAQAINRRVVIKMRKGVPEDEPILVKPLIDPPRAAIIEESSAEADGENTQPPQPSEPAVEIPEPPAQLPRATVVEETVPIPSRAQRVEEDQEDEQEEGGEEELPGRAVPVE